MTDNFRAKTFQQSVMRIKVCRKEIVHATVFRGIHFSHHICDSEAMQRPFERGLIKVDGNGVDVMD